MVNSFDSLFTYLKSNITDPRSRTFEVSGQSFIIKGSKVPEKTYNNIGYPFIHISLDDKRNLLKRHGGTKRYLNTVSVIIYSDKISEVDTLRYSILDLFKDIPQSSVYGGRDFTLLSSNIEPNQINNVDSFAGYITVSYVSIE